MRSRSDTIRSIIAGLLTILIGVACTLIPIADIGKTALYIILLIAHSLQIVLAFYTGCQLYIAIKTLNRKWWYIVFATIIVTIVAACLIYESKTVDAFLKRFE